MACRLIGVKPLSEPMLIYCKLNPLEQTSLKFELNALTFLEEIAFENVICKMSAILFWPQCVNTSILKIIPSFMGSMSSCLNSGHHLKVHHVLTWKMMSKSRRQFSLSCQFSCRDVQLWDPGQNGHTPKWPHPKRPQHFWLPKRPQPKRPHCIGQNGHIGRITTKTAKLHLVKTATKGGSLPKRPHCIWSKRPHREDHYQNGHTAFGQNGHTGREDHWTSLPRTATLVKQPQHESLPKRPHYRSLAGHQSHTRMCLLSCSRAHFSNDIFPRN